MADANRRLELARRAQEKLPEDSGERLAVVGAADFLGQLLLQDVKRSEGDNDDGDDSEVRLMDGVSKDRLLSVHDPEMRYGHKASSNALTRIKLRWW